MSSPRYPSLYQVNTRVWLTDLSQSIGRPAKLDDIPDKALDEFVEQGFDWIWFLSVWQTGLAGQAVSRSNAQWRAEFAETLPDLREEDIPGSGFAITAYEVHGDLGGNAALARLRERLQTRGLRLMLDFVPNHTGLDHHWVAEHPEYYVAGTEHDLASAPQNYTLVKRTNGDLILAFGRDPYFAGWPDTLQLNYANPMTQAAMQAELLRIAGQCDGVRCDMAMLVLPEIFARTWGTPAPSFWPKATRRVREAHPQFCFLAEVYWDLEWTMQQQGFDYAYDKRLYDRLRDAQAIPIRQHLSAGLDYQDKLARFLENHDEPRAASVFADDIHRAAAIITYLSPGLRFFHQGQFEGKRQRISPHLGRGPVEPVHESLRNFYLQLLAMLRADVFRNGHWQLCECTNAWDGNLSCKNFLAFAWQSNDVRSLVTVNYAGHQGQCHVRLPWTDLAGQPWRLFDEIGKASYDWHGDDLMRRGLYVDMQPWQACVFTFARHP